MSDYERVDINDKVLACIPNMYMLKQLLWYHEKYPEGSWDALVIDFGNRSMVDTVVGATKKTGLFENVFVSKGSFYDASTPQKIMMFMRMMVSFLLLRKKQFAQNTIAKITGDFNYKKTIILNISSVYAGLLVNAMDTGEIVCLEDGLSDYFEYAKWPTQMRQIPQFMLAKMGFCSIALHEMRPFTSNMSKKCIKYNSLPSKLQYRNYLEIKQLFEGDESHTDLNRELPTYDLIIFSTCLEDLEKDADRYYDALHLWLLQHYPKNKILIKRHPRETYAFNWSDLNIEFAPDNVAGEDLLDEVQCDHILLLYTSTLLLKLCRENFSYEVIYFEKFKSEVYHSGFEKCRAFFGIEQSRIVNI